MIRRAFPDAKKVAASRTCGEATFLLDDEIDEKKIKMAVAGIGYSIVVGGI